MLFQCQVQWKQQPAKIIIKKQQTTKHHKHYVSIHFFVSVGFFLFNMIYIMNVSRWSFPTKKTEIVEHKRARELRMKNDHRRTHKKIRIWAIVWKPIHTINGLVVRSHSSSYFVVVGGGVCVTFDGYYYYIWWKLKKAKYLAQPFNLGCRWRKIKAFPKWLISAAWRRRTFIYNAKQFG